MKRWSLDARSKEQSAYSFWGKSRNQKVLAVANGTSWRASGRVGRLRVEEDRPRLIPEQKRASSEVRLCGRSTCTVAGQAKPFHVGHD